MADQVPDFNKLMKIAQQVASNMEPPPQFKKGKKMTESDMSGLFGHVAQNVAKVMTPELIESVSGSSSSAPPASPIVDSKISLEPKKKNKRVVEIESDASSEEDTINPRTKDMNFTLGVSLEEIYNGTKKKLAIRRQQLNSDGSITDEKKKLSIKIEHGMIDEQTIRFNHMADEKKGCETGDVVVSLDVEEHSDFIRDGNNLLIERELSFSDTFSPVFYVKHLNGKTLKIIGDQIDAFDEDDELKKVPGMGMPVLGEIGKFGDLFIRIKCVNDVKLNEEQINTLKTIFPSKLSKPEGLSDEDITETQFEMVTESDLEFLEDSDEDYTDSEEDSDSEESD
jgi:hypothetical protein